MGKELQRPQLAIEQFCRRLDWKDLDVDYLRRLIASAKDEDLEGSGLAEKPSRSGDVTTDSLPLEIEGTARLVARESLTVCGLPLTPLVLEAFGPGCLFEPTARDGDRVEKGEALGTVSGPAATLLQAERVMLNFVQHLSGIATQTARYLEALGKSRTRLLDTRKTTPGLRVLEKYAVARGGGWNHRLGLFDRVLLKDNHLAASGLADNKGLADAVRTIIRKNPDVIVEVEVDRINQIEAVLNAGADVILLDNFSLSEVTDAVALIGGRAYIEVSGSITPDSLAALAATGVDFISCGALVHQSVWKDIGLDWK